METDILTQATELVSAIALGVCFGFLYEVFRLPRHLFPRLSFVFDLAFCLVVALGLFTLGMVCGGTLRYYMPFAAMLGAAVYSAIFGRWLRPLSDKLESFVGKWLNALKKQAKKMYKNFKNIFSSAQKRFRITKYSKDDKLGENVSKSGALSARRKGEHYEISQNGHTGKTYYPGDPDLCSFHDG